MQASFPVGKLRASLYYYAFAGPLSTLPSTAQETTVRFQATVLTALILVCDNRSDQLEKRDYTPRDPHSVRVGHRLIISSHSYSPSGYTASAKVRDSPSGSYPPVAVCHLATMLSVTSHQLMQAVPDYHLDDRPTKRIRPEDDLYPIPGPSIPPETESGDGSAKRNRKRPLSCGECRRCVSSACTSFTPN